MGPKGNQKSKGGLDARRAEWGGYGNGLSFNFDKKKQNGALWSVNQAVSLVMYTALLVMDPEAISSSAAEGGCRPISAFRVREAISNKEGGGAPWKIYNANGAFGDHFSPIAFWGRFAIDVPMWRLH